MHNYPSTLLNMIISNTSVSTRIHYNHAPLAESAMKQPGVWFADDSEDYPTISAAQVRRGQMTAYRPAGAFNVRRIDGVGHVSFIGVPKEPWEPASGAPFDKLERTMNPDRCPEGTPENVLKALRKYRKRSKKKAQHKLAK